MWARGGGCEGRMQARAGKSRQEQADTGHCQISTSQSTIQISLFAKESLKESNG